MYSAKNQIAIAHYRSITEDIGWYVVGNKSIMIDQNYVGVGITYRAPGTPGLIFTEFGSSYSAWKPGVYVGVLLPFYRKIK